MFETIQTYCTVGKDMKLFLPERILWWHCRKTTTVIVQLLLSIMNDINLHRLCACVGVVRILYLKVYDFPHNHRHFVRQWNSSYVHVDPFLAPYQQY